MAELDYIKMAKEFVESDLHMTIMCGPLSTMEQRVKEAIQRNFELMEKAIRFDLEQKFELVKKRGKNDE